AGKPARLHTVIEPALEGAPVLGGDQGSPLCARSDHARVPVPWTARLPANATPATRSEDAGHADASAFDQTRSGSGSAGLRAGPATKQVSLPCVSAASALSASAGGLSSCGGREIPDRVHRC